MIGDENGYWFSFYRLAHGRVLYNIMHNSEILEIGIGSQGFMWDRYDSIRLRKAMRMNDDELKIYNEAGAAAVAGSRTRLAHALRAARNSDRKFHFINGKHVHPSGTNLADRIRYHASFIGWPLRLRPNGRYT